MLGRLWRRLFQKPVLSSERDHLYDIIEKDGRRNEKPAEQLPLQEPIPASAFKVNRPETIRSVQEQALRELFPARPKKP